jgi:hypothetical protein
MILRRREMTNELSGLLNYFDQRLLPPDMLDPLRKLNLVFYDGGLICSIIDQRREHFTPIRLHLRIHPDDIVALGFELEQEYLFASYPLLCLENRIEVFQVSRISARDRDKWKGISARDSAAGFLQREYPSLFVDDVPQVAPPPNRPICEMSEPEFLERLMKKLGLS